MPSLLVSVSARYVYKMIIPNHSLEWPIPTHLTVDEDNLPKWQNAPPLEGRYPSKTCSFALPVRANSLFLLSQGPHSSGTLTLFQSQDAGESVKVDVTISCPDDYILSRYVKVCGVHSGENEYGIGIFTKGQLYRFNNLNEIHLRFDVVVKFPKSQTDGAPLRIKKFETSMPLFYHTVGDLARTMIFDAITLRTANTPIVVKSLCSPSMTLETSNSPIEGHLVSSSSLTLLTTNAEIKTNIQLENDDVSSSTASELRMHTANCPIDSQISLTSSSQSGGKFKIAANSSLASVNINLKSAPKGSMIDLAARTSMAPASVRMPPSFEGRFLVMTSMAQALVNAAPSSHPSDPARREVDYTSRFYNSVNGAVGWSEEGKRKGHVEVSSSMSPARLTL